MGRQYQYRTVDGRETVQIAVRGRQVLTRPMLNFGPGYTPSSAALGLTGLLPPAEPDRAQDDPEQVDARCG